MTEVLEKYNHIMSKYYNGDFGNKNLTMTEILKCAGEPDLFEKMNLSEIQFLIDTSSGLTKAMFCAIKKQKIAKSLR